MRTARGPVAPELGREPLAIRGAATCRRRHPDVRVLATRAVRTLEHRRRRSPERARRERPRARGPLARGAQISCLQFQFRNWIPHLGERARNHTGNTVARAVL